MNLMRWFEVHQTCNQLSTYLISGIALILCYFCNVFMYHIVLYFIVLYCIALNDYVYSVLPC